jgi:hypothetical protein
MSRLCIYCKHFEISYEGDWSEITPGAGFEAGCNKYIWREDGDSVSAEGHRKNLERGLTCPKFEAADDSTPNPQEGL